ncbi:LysR substrate-binding domain-containing protein [Kineococcus gynurae]|uniref:LysR substrate-binding domain-containing protein n=1 Tax=Kineococcus gynurae TaxID=452979 RepID=A0ABV5LQ64_9ACTN
MLDVHRLRLLRELSRRGTLAAVAKALSYSPSAVSQQLALLEAEAGVALLEKVGRGVRLTAQGRLLVDHADAVLQRLEQAEADLAASVDEVAGTVRVASFQSVLLAVVPVALDHLRAAHPRLRLEITQAEPEESFAALLAHDVDLVLGEQYPGMSAAPAPGVAEEDLTYDEMRLALPAEGPWTVPAGWGRTADLTGLAAAPWVMDPVAAVPGRWLRDLCRDAGFEPDVRFETPDLVLHAHLVETGHALAVLPDLLWTWGRPRVRLVRLPGRPARRLYTGVRRGSVAHPAVLAIREALRVGVATAAERRLL